MEMNKFCSCKGSATYIIIIDHTISLVPTTFGNFCSPEHFLLEGPHRLCMRVLGSKGPSNEASVVPSQFVLSDKQTLLIAPQVGY